MWIRSYCFGPKPTLKCSLVILQDYQVARKWLLLGPFFLFKMTLFSFLSWNRDVSTSIWLLFKIYFRHFVSLHWLLFWPVYLLLILFVVTFFLACLILFIAFQCFWILRKICHRKNGLFSSIFLRFWLPRGRQKQNATQVPTVCNVRIGTRS